MWNFILKEDPAPVEEIKEETKEDLLAINQAAVAAEEKAGLIDEVKETKEDLLAIHEAAMKAEEAGSIAEDNEYNVDLTFLGNAK